MSVDIRELIWHSASVISTDDWTKRNRLAKGLSQADLAEAADLSRETIGKVERGQTAPDPLTQAKLENAFGVKFPNLIETPSDIVAARSEDSVDLANLVDAVFPGQSNRAALVRAALVTFASLDRGTVKGMVEIAGGSDADTAVRMLNQIWPVKLLRAAGELDDESIDQLIAYAKSALPPRDSGRNEDATP